MPTIIDYFTDPKILGLVRLWTDSDKTYIQVLRSERERLATPEEMVRQITVAALIARYGYPENLIKCEVTIPMGRERKRADIVLLSDSGAIVGVIEAKQEIDPDAEGQLESYLMASGAKFGCITSRTGMKFFERSPHFGMHEVSDIPFFNGDTSPLNAPQTAEHIYLGLPIEALTRTSRSSVRITISGETFDMSNTEAANLRSIKMRLLEVGAVINTSNLNQKEWLIRISKIIAKTEVTEVAELAELIQPDKINRMNIGFQTIDQLRSAFERKNGPLFNGKSCGIHVLRDFSRAWRKLLSDWRQPEQSPKHRRAIETLEELGVVIEKNVGMKGYTARYVGTVETP